MLQKIAYIFVLFMPCFISCLLFLYWILKLIYTAIKYFICKYKYRNLVKSHLYMCKKCEDRLKQDNELYQIVLNNFMRSLYIE